MTTKKLILALALFAVMSLAAPRLQAQVVGGGYVGFNTPGVSGVIGVGAPVVAPAPVVAAPVVPYVAPYGGVVMGGGPIFAPRPIYRAGWGYGPRYFGPRYYRYGYRRRVW
jgi:hypothetical protein